MGIDYIYRNAKLPKLAKVKREFIVDSIDDVVSETRKTMETSGIESKLKKGGTIGIGIGSRGITSLSEISRAVVDWFKDKGMKPFIFPAMGSHGGATAEGQVRQLASVGVTEEIAGCPILSDMEATVVGQYDTGVKGIKLNAYFDKHGFAADNVFFLSRIKPHPGFTGPHESGFCKMLTIGCGKHICAETCHRLGYDFFPGIMVGMSQVILEKMPHLVGALAIVENALHGTALLECVTHENIMAKDTEILQYAKTCMPDLPLKEMHALSVDYMGKNISGPGMDPNITGRYLTNRTGDIKMGGLCVLNLTKEAYGNGNGMGAADYITQKIFDNLNLETSYLNGLTDPATVKDVSIPPIMPNDYGAMCMALMKGNTFDEDPLFCRIRDTLTLEKLLVSQAVVDKIIDKPGYTLVEEPRELEFDSNGNLADKYKIWDTF